MKFIPAIVKDAFARVVCKMKAEKSRRIEPKVTLDDLPAQTPENADSLIKADPAKRLYNPKK